jgi:hypothetical protein
MEPVLAVIIGLVAVVGLFLIFRALMLWYWRINDSITLLASIDSKLGKLIEIGSLNTHDAAKTTLPSRPPISPATNSADLRAKEAEAMSQYGITQEGSHYSFNGKQFVNLSDALFEARRRPSDT